MPIVLGELFSLRSEEASFRGLRQERRRRGEPFAIGQLRARPRVCGGGAHFRGYPRPRLHLISSKRVKREDKWYLEVLTIGPANSTVTSVVQLPDIGNRTQASLQPLYEEVSSLITAEIRRGALRPGSPLPPDAVMCEQLGVSRVTLRKALVTLANAGLLAPSTGRAWFVADSLVGELPNMLQSLTEVAAARGLRITSRVTLVHVREASWTRPTNSRSLRAVPCLRCDACGGSTMCRCPFTTCGYLSTSVHICPRSTSRPPPFIRRWSTTAFV